MVARGDSFVVVGRIGKFLERGPESYPSCGPWVASEYCALRDQSLVQFDVPWRSSCGEGA
jgi:hypothetical protein